jgi:hypothetical protein
MFHNRQERIGEFETSNMDYNSDKVGDSPHKAPETFQNAGGVFLSSQNVIMPYVERWEDCTEAGVVLIVPNPLNSLSDGLRGQSDMIGSDSFTADYTAPGGVDIDRDTYYIYSAFSGITSSECLFPPHRLLMLLVYLDN